MIKPFRGKHHSQRVADALFYSEQLATFSEIDELEKEFQSHQAGRVYDESREGAILADKIRRLSANSMAVHTNNEFRKIIGGGK